ncbi:MAG: glycosyltransferase [Bdellovibrionales bacterium]|nr:glycosyltransferase [Bdellovibrionales bacterium]
MNIVLAFIYYAGIFGVFLTGLYKLRFFILFRKLPNRIGPTRKFEKLPKITLQIPVYNEKYVVVKILNSIVDIEYPKSLLEIQILDDSTDETSNLIQKTISTTALRHMNINHVKRVSRKGYKAGALKQGLKYATGEYIAIFDADFVIPRRFLLDTIPYFSAPSIGCVQARWEFLNANESNLTRVQALALRAHFQIEQQVRYHTNMFMTYNGTGGIWRKEAILQSGNWNENNLTEDLELSFRAQLNSWKIVYANHIVAYSLLPNRFADFKKQQERWAKGSIQSLKHLLLRILQHKIDLRTRIEAAFQLARHLSFMFAFFTLMTMPWVLSQRPKHDPLNILDAIFFLLSTFLLFIYFLPVAENRSKSLSTLKTFFMLCIYGLSLSPSIVLSIIEGLICSSGEFNRTPKIVGKQKTDVNPSYMPKVSGFDLVSALVCSYFWVCIYVFFSEEFWISKPLIFLTGFSLSIPIFAHLNIFVLNKYHNIKTRK